MMDINYLNFQMNQLKEKHEVTDDRCLHGQSKHRKGLKSLPDVMQTFSLVCSSLFSKILFSQFQAILQVFSWQMRTHLLEWEKPLLYLSDNKKSDFFFFFLSHWEILDFQGEEFALRGSIYQTVP